MGLLDPLYTAYIAVILTSERVAHILLIWTFCFDVLTIFRRFPLLFVISGALGPVSGFPYK